MRRSPTSRWTRPGCRTSAPSYARPSRRRTPSSRCTAVAAAPSAAGAAMGWPAPLDSLLPQSTEQVMHPERFLRFRDNPTELVVAPTPDPRWRTIYENVMGEMETTVFLRQHLGESAGARGWDGDRFRLMEGPGGLRGLVWYSVWDDAPSADAF